MATIDASKLVLDLIRLVKNENSDTHERETFDERAAILEAQFLDRWISNQHDQAMKSVSKKFDGNHAASEQFGWWIAGFDHHEACSK